ncbi:protein-L-isoaspartate(D-aspartate) O-methyltransferase [Sphingosinicella terrae]|uniref:protein-L-isoaspartate(D-aspartate) O-methyltransferase n=1 Tax=Sphingosinicella terrae TaxID=2172047 RepID=UPI000E0CC690|nr:protein-L-isoaspartate(D-aspartate) O-methyltransferase [Sphingosinicella terrae]
MKPMTEEHLAILRRHMVEVIELHFDLAEEEIGRDTLGPALRRALMETPRHLFVPAQLMAAAYQDTPLPIGFDKTLSQPFIGALMLELLEIESGQRVLEVGTGLGWQAAIMSELGATLYSVEIVEEFAQAARLRLAAIDHDVEIRVGDGSRGWSDHAPFDRILVTAAASEPPPALVEQLAPNGRMVIPIGSKEVQQLSVVEKTADGRTGTRAVLPVRFTQLELA